MKSGSETVQRHDSTEANELRHELNDLYSIVYVDQLDQPFRSVAEFDERLGNYLRADGFVLVTARLNGQLVGYAFGSPLPADTRWWEGMVTPVEPATIAETGSRTFALREIMVRPDLQRQRIATALHDSLLGNRTEERATLLVIPNNTPALRAYASWGWVRIGRLRPMLPNAPLNDALILDLQKWRIAR